MCGHWGIGAMLYGYSRAPEGVLDLVVLLYFKAMSEASAYLEGLDYLEEVFRTVLNPNP